MNEWNGMNGWMGWMDNDDWGFFFFLENKIKKIVLTTEFKIDIPYILLVRVVS